jgi:hypothetical protein
MRQMSMAMNLSQRRSAEDRAHRQRCKRLPPMQADQVNDLMAVFLATRHVTLCPTRYAVATAQGTPLPHFAR